MLYVRCCKNHYTGDADKKEKKEKKKKYQNKKYPPQQEERLVLQNFRVQPCLCHIACISIISFRCRLRKNLCCKKAQHQQGFAFLESG